MKNFAAVILAGFCLCTALPAAADEPLEAELYDLLIEALEPPPLAAYQTKQCNYWCPNGVGNNVWATSATACWQLCEDFCGASYGTGCGAVTFGTRGFGVSNSGGNASGAIK